MSKTVLITRPEEDAKPIADLLIKKGYTVFCEPFLQILLHEYDLPDLTTYQGLIFTSANGVRAFCLNSKDRELRAFTVGHNTAEEAKRSGFTNVQSADGGVEELEVLLFKDLASKPYLHIRGEHLARPFDVDVAGVQIDEKVLYCADFIEEISNETLDLIIQGDLDYIMFFSRRTVESFTSYLYSSPRMEELQEGVKRTKALCLADSMVRCLSVLPWKDIVVSSHPNRDAMMDLLD